MFFVATDLDGTLLTSDRQVTERAKRTLATVRSSGGAVVLVTARPLRDVTAIGREVGADFLVCSGGAVRYDPIGGELVHANGLAAERATDLLSTLRLGVPGIRLGVDHLDRCELDPGFHVGTPGVADRQASEPLRQVTGQAVKLIAQSDLLPVDRLAERIRAVAGPSLQVTVPCSWFVDVLPAGVHKGVGLGELRDRHGRVLRSVAFGDMPSDLPMLRWADISVAMANAHPAVLAACDHVTAHHDADGVAAYLECLISTGG